MGTDKINSASTFGEAVNVWVQNSADRAFESSQRPEGAQQEIALYAARNEYEASQVLVRSQNGLHGLSLAASDLIGEGGNKIPSADIIIYREYSASASVGGNVEPVPDHSDRYTDALLPVRPMDVDAGITQPYWVRVYVPKDQQAGIYQGNVTVTASEGSFQIPLMVKVYDVTIPDTDQSSFKMINWFSTAGVDYDILEASIVNQYHVELFDENWWKVIENIAADLALHRNNVIFMDVEALLLPKSTMSVGKAGDSTYLFDWSYYDRMVDIFQKAGALQYIYLAGNRKVMKEADNRMMIYVMTKREGKMIRELIPIYTDQEKEIINPDAQKYVETLYRALRCHMQERYPQLLDKLYVSALDEPFTEAENKASDWFYQTVRSVYPEALSNEAHCRFTMGMTQSTTLCPVLDAYEENQSYYQQQKEAGRELWYYTCIIPQGDYMNRFIPYYLTGTRLIPWYAYKIGAAGYLHWGYSYWGDKDTFDSVQTGDEWLVRPDAENYDIFTSVRNEVQLDGLEDYELLRQLSARDKDAADRVVDTVIKDAVTYTKDGSAVVNAHKMLLDLLTEQQF